MNPDKMEIKDELVLHGMTWEASDEIEFNTIDVFQTRNINMPVYYILYGQVINIPYRNNINVMHPIIQL